MIECGRKKTGSGMSPSRLWWLLLPAVAFGCSRTVNDHLREAETGSPQAVGEAVVAISELLAMKEASQIAFDEGDQAAVVYMKQVALESKIQTNRSIALGALAKLRTVNAEEIFIKALDDPFWHARFHAVRGLKIQPKESCAELLRNLLVKETQVEVRVEIVKALGMIGGPVALKTLFETFLKPTSRHQDEQVHAFLALRFLTGASYEFNDGKSWKKAFQERFPQAAGEGVGS
ncbi:MAG: HEAT repeat domain-containing protein [Planctomycetes bacterium]|nr:HEAT repeat domain-containing protein [Planctomycetota bacterium]